MQERLCKIGHKVARRAEIKSFFFETVKWKLMLPYVGYIKNLGKWNIYFVMKNTFIRSSAVYGYNSQ